MRFRSKSVRYITRGLVHAIGFDIILTCTVHELYNNIKNSGSYRKRFTHKQTALLNIIPSQRNDGYFLPPARVIQIYCLKSQSLAVIYYYCNAVVAQRWTVVATSWCYKTNKNKRFIDDELRR